MTTRRRAGSAALVVLSVVMTAAVPGVRGDVTVTATVSPAVSAVPQRDKDYRDRLDETFRLHRKDPGSPGLRERYLWLIREGSGRGYWKEVVECAGRLKDLTATDPSFRRNHAREFFQAKLAEEGVQDFEVNDLDGAVQSIGKYKGSVLLLDFWATWCGPCRSEMPDVKRTYDRYHDQGFEIIGISGDRDLPKLRRWLEEQDVPWPQFCDGRVWNNELFKLYEIRSIPATILIGRDGKLAAIGLRGQELEDRIAELVGERRTGGAGDGETGGRAWRKQ